ncbi:MAG: hypothetical protein HOA60_08110, partial [Rhodospirillales bacterium]|nr:hypothetical protein [Rhodospirillales bacterium]
MNNPDDNNSNLASEEKEPTPADVTAREATVMQVLPAMGTSGGVERGTVEIANA